MSNHKVPYVISMAHPDYKRPRVSYEHKVAISEAEAINQCIEHLALYITQSFNESVYLSCKHINELYRSFSQTRDSYMENPFWQAMIFCPSTNEWKDLSQLDNEYGAKALTIMRKNLKVKEDQDDEEDEEDNDK